MEGYSLKEMIESDLRVAQASLDLINVKFFGEFKPGSMLDNYLIVLQDNIRKIKYTLQQFESEAV